MGAATLVLPRKAQSKQEFVRRWAGHLTEAQMGAVLDAYGNRVSDVSDVLIAVRLKNGSVETLAAPSA